jgi:hypothetical protein
MTKAQAKTNDFIDLDEIPATLGKFSNNVVPEKGEEEGDEPTEVGVFTLTFSEIMISKELFNLVMDDPHAHRAFYNDKRGVYDPMPWLSSITQPIRINRKFDQGKFVIAYSESPSRNTRRDRFEDVKVGSIIVVAKSGTGGNSELKMHVQVKPGLGEANLRLQEFQNRRVAISLSELHRYIKAESTKRAATGPQADLELGPGGRNGQEGTGAGMAAAAGARAKDADEEAGRAQAEALARSTPSTH